MPVIKIFLCCARKIFLRLENITLMCTKTINALHSRSVFNNIFFVWFIYQPKVSSLYPSFSTPLPAPTRKVGILYSYGTPNLSCLNWLSCNLLANV